LFKNNTNDNINDNINDNTNNNTNNNIDIDNMMNNINISKAPVNNRAIIYARVSSKNQLNGDSIEMQLFNCKDYCNKNNLIIHMLLHVINLKDLQLVNHIQYLIIIVNNLVSNIKILFLRAIYSIIK
jgi:predicted site-specific integrase-resolvase